MSSDLVRTDAFKKAFLESGLTARELAEELGWYTKPHPDGQRVRQALGLVVEHRKGGGSKFRERVHKELALQLCEALGVDPIDVGL